MAGQGKLKDEYKIIKSEEVVKSSAPGHGCCQLGGDNINHNFHAVQQEQPLHQTHISALQSAFSG